MSIVACSRFLPRLNMGPQMAANSTAKLCTTLHLPAVFVLMSRHHAADCLHSILQCLLVMRQGTKNIPIEAKDFSAGCEKRESEPHWFGKTSTAREHQPHAK
ncbi:hypothetical protein MPL3356_270030 [Mesorhizobium plurifarium]|uniref:Uncharacterized protein n=1 Tax=Mesorhizobium plurifarium TaxID=69974 RepID=A0A090DU98_MESPL|nr:hypothetical protein MPL3356_270030 [Mesorhizobium plurifarium]